MSICFSSEESLAYIHDFSGEVYIESNDQNQSTLPAISGRSIYNGNIIRVKDGSYCDIYTHDKRMFIRLDSNTDIEMVTTSDTREIYIKNGSIYVDNVSLNSNIKTFIFSDFSQIYLTNSKVWVSSDEFNYDMIFTFGNEINVSDKYIGIRYHDDQVNMVHAYEEEISSVDSVNPIYDFQNIVPSYIFDEFIVEKNKYIQSDSLFFDITEADLIPNYYANVDTEILEESNLGFNVHAGGAYIYDSDYATFAIEPYFSWNNLDVILKIDEYIDLQDSEIKINDWLDPSVLLSKINYISYYNDNKTVFLNVGKLKNLTFGHGQLLHKYSNSYNYPVMQRTGAQVRISPKNKHSYSFDFFISDAAQLIKDGGFYGYHFSLFLSKFFPLELGYGYLADLNQYSEVDFDFVSGIKAREFDLEYNITKNKKYEINLISEFDAIYFNKTLKYYRYDDEDGVSSALKQRDGTFGAMAGAKFIFDSGHKFLTGFHYNGELYTPYYFSSTYDFEKIRTLVFNPSSNSSHNLNSTLPFFDDICNNEAEESCSEGDLLYLSKELYPLFSKDDFVYSTIGTSLEYEYNYYNKRGVSMSGMYLVDNSNKSNRSYYLFDFEIFSKGGYLFSWLDSYKLYFHRNFSVSNSNQQNIMFGTQFDIKIFESLELNIDMQNVFYDINQDSDTEDIKMIHFIFKYQF